MDVQPFVMVPALFRVVGALTPIVSGSLGLQ